MSCGCAARKTDKGERREKKRETRGREVGSLGWRIKEIQITKLERVLARRKGPTEVKDETKTLKIK